MAAGIALAAKRGKRTPESLQGAARTMYETMSERQLDDLASTMFSGGKQRTKERER